MEIGDWGLEGKPQWWWKYVTTPEVSWLHLTLTRGVRRSQPYCRLSA